MGALNKFIRFFFSGWERMRKVKILLIDDEVDVGATVKKGLEIFGNYNVAVTTNGKRGIALARRLRPSLILLDIKMPGMDGFKVLELLKKDRRTVAIPVVMFTNIGDDDYKIKAAQLYDEEYIVKTIELNKLRAKIEEILSRHAGIPRFKHV